MAENPCLAIPKLDKTDQRPPHSLQPKRKLIPKMPKTTSRAGRPYSLITPSPLDLVGVFQQKEAC